MKTAWFTFGVQDTHVVNGFTFDHKMVLQLTSANPRASMAFLFGESWDMEYNQPPDLMDFPRGIIKMDGPPS